MMRKLILIILLSISVGGVLAQQREVRAVWLTTNGGLDWPKGVFDVLEQKKSLVEILDRLAAANFNTILFQVQATGDVAWMSSLQPAMASITGNGSSALKYDVAQYVIEQCHARNMECHAWVAPYRVGSASGAARYDSNEIKHVIRTHPEMCIKYSGNYYLDPGLPETRQYLVDLYRELLENYDFDGINLDYTRYPGVDFDDSASYNKDNNPDGLSKDDWRRQNINMLVADIYDMAKTIDPYIKVGSAPIGTYKNVPGYSNSTAYYSFFQDPGQWCGSENHDLVIPQMYWTEKYGFSTNMKTWVANCNGRQIIVGLAPYKMDVEDWDVSVITGQIEKARETDGISGVCFFRTDHVIGAGSKVRGLYEALTDDYFKQPAHIPSMSYNGATTPNAPRNVEYEHVGDKYIIAWNEPELDSDNTPIRYYSIYLTDGVSVDRTNPDNVVVAKVAGTRFEYPSKVEGLQFAVSAFDCNYYESRAAMKGETGIEDVLVNDDFIYSYDVLRVRSDRPLDRVEVYTMMGACSMYCPVSGCEAWVDCSPLQEGMYIARTVDENGDSKVNKFVK